jgi:Tfp pilus assembly protein PilV
MKYSSPDKKGFTLIEVLLATVLVVFGVVAVVSAMATGVYTDSSIEGQAIALNLAQEQMETIKNTAYANINTTNFPTGLIPLTGSFANYSRQVTFLPSGSGTNSSPTTQVTVSVSWQLGLMQSSVSLTTLLTQPS